MTTETATKPALDSQPLKVLMGRHEDLIVIDDHSRLAYAEIHDDEKAVTAIAVLRNAIAWFNARGVTIERVLSDNGSAYKSHA